MKTLRTLLAAMMLLIGSAVMNAQPMSYNAIRNNARFLTDRMAYTLGINDPYLIDDMYRINYDFICGVNDYLDDVALGYRYDDYMSICDYRDYALRSLLGDIIWSRLMGYDYFYRPIIFENYRWRFSIYAFDNLRTHYYCSIPTYYNTYRGGHFFTGMRPGVSRGPRPADYHGGFRDGRRGVTVNSHVRDYRDPGRPGSMHPTRTGDMRGERPNAGNRGGDVNRGERPNMGNRGDMNRPGNNAGVSRPGNNNADMNRPTVGDRGQVNRSERPSMGERGGQVNRSERPSMSERPSTSAPSRNSGTVSGPSRSGGTVSAPSRSGNSGGMTRGGSFGGGSSSRGGNAGGGARGGRR